MLPTLAPRAAERAAPERETPSAGRIAVTGAVNRDVVRDISSLPHAALFGVSLIAAQGWVDHYFTVEQLADGPAVPAMIAATLVALAARVAAARVHGRMRLRGSKIARRAVYTSGAALAVFAVVHLGYGSPWRTTAAVCAAAFALAMPAVLVGDSLMQSVLDWLAARRGVPIHRRVAIIGEPALVERAGAALAAVDPEAEILLVPQPRRSGTELYDADDALVAALSSLHGRLDEIVVATSASRDRIQPSALAKLADVPVKVSLFVQELEALVARIGPAAAIGSPFLPLIECRSTGWSALLKIAFDRVAALLLLVALAPLFLLVALLIKLDSRGPVFFRQRRQGLNHAEFLVWKFRTMRHDPVGDGRFMQARSGDSRITRVGRWLRRSSIDELPQLFNVLCGQMSLVGPRPHPTPLNEAYRDDIPLFGARHRVLPGITGLAQIEGHRGETDTLDKMRARVEHDLTYVGRSSIVLDLWILMQTVWRGFFHPNAR